MRAGTAIIAAHATAPKCVRRFDANMVVFLLQNDLLTALMRQALYRAFGRIRALTAFG
jgi:hypothetical protein